MSGTACKFTFVNFELKNDMAIEDTCNRISAIVECTQRDATNKGTTTCATAVETNCSTSTNQNNTDGTTVQGSSSQKLFSSVSHPRETAAQFVLCHQAAVEQINYIELALTTLLLIRHFSHPFAQKRQNILPQHSQTQMCNAPRFPICP